MSDEDTVTVEEIVVQGSEIPNREELFTDISKQRRSVKRDLLAHPYIYINEILFGESLLSLLGSILLIVFSFIGYFSLVSVLWNIFKLLFSYIALSPKYLESKTKHSKYKVFYRILSFGTVLIFGLYIYTMSLEDINSCRIDPCDKRFIFIISIIGPIQIVMSLVEGVLYNLLFKKSILYIDYLNELERINTPTPLQNDPNVNNNAPQAQPAQPAPNDRILTPANEYRLLSRLIAMNKFFALLWIQVSYATVQFTNTVIMMLWAAQRYSLIISILWSVFKLATLGYTLYKLQDKSADSNFTMRTLKIVWAISFITFFSIIIGYSEVFEDYPDCGSGGCIGLQGYIEILAANLIAVITSIDVFYIFQVIKTAEKYFQLVREKDMIFAALPYTNENVDIISPPITEATNKVRTFANFYEGIHSKLVIFSLLHSVLSTFCIICFYPAPFSIVSLLWNIVKTTHFWRIKRLIRNKTFESTKRMMKQIICVLLISFLLIIAIFEEVANENLITPSSWLSWISSPVLYITLAIHSFEISIISFSLLCGKSLLVVLTERDGYSSGQGRN